MAKYTAPAFNRRKPAEIGERKLKHVNKKTSKLMNLPERGILGIVNGFTVTRLEPGMLRVKRIFPASAGSPVIEADGATFAWAEETEQNSESRLHRAYDRRTSSTQDSAANSLNEFDASREPKRRRTIESSIVEDAEARKATSSMRLLKPLLQDSTPAEALERGGPSSQRVLNNTFEDTSVRDGDGEGAVEPRVSLTSIFDEETNLEKSEDRVRGIEKCREKNSLNFDENTVELDVFDLPEVTPVRPRSRKVEDASRINRTLNENTENASVATVSANGNTSAIWKPQWIQ